MKKSILFIATAFAFSQMSFMTKSNSSTHKAKKAPAIAFTANVALPFELAVEIPCANKGNGDVILFEGDLHDLYHITINKNSAVLKTHDNPQGISGTSSVNGQKYQATGVTQSQSKIFSTNGVFEGTFVNNFRIIGQGPGNNYIVHEVSHITFNANGVITADVENFTVDCK